MGESVAPQRSGAELADRASNMAEWIWKATPCRLIELAKRGAETVLASGAAEDE
ncbi:hypothetical protein AB3662_06500 [Sorangium cellulosum]|uniref:hypothetical protein n=1 Tax=Sorangium cellulosum TaxID=56 RepID=UPI003D9A346F